MTARRNAVGTYLGKRAFYTQDMARRHRAGQDTTLPPRCVHCRLPGTVTRDGTPHCVKNHALLCDCTVSETKDLPESS